MSRPYFQFPICAFAFPGSESERLNNIISYACVEQGKRQWAKLTEAKRRYRRSGPPIGRNVCASPINPNNETQLQAVLGAEFLDMRTGELGDMLMRHEALTAFIKKFEAKHGKDARVRIVTEWVFEARDHMGMSYWDLAILAAIYSKIGRHKGAVRITRDEIWRRAHGYKSAGALKAAFPPLRRYGQDLVQRNFQHAITQRQVRSAIERLHARKFFARTTYAKRQTYYSHRLSKEELIEKVFQLKTRRFAARQTRMNDDMALTNRVQTEIRRLASLGIEASAGGNDTPDPAT